MGIASYEILDFRKLSIVLQGIKKGLCVMVRLRSCPDIAYRPFMVLAKTVTSKFPELVSPVKIPSWLSTAAFAFPTITSASPEKGIEKLHADI
jgi:hypothetical protein